ncbi:MAG: hypothetical protein GWN37_19990, partial [Gammaproteobacteria bacterium]|nr:hypothetical protein [Gammaproteobacteria bacterium]
DLASPEVSLLVPHFTVEVRRQLGELPGIEPDMIARGGLVVHTTIDMGIQAMAEDIVRQQIAEVGDEYNMHNGALVALNPNTGEVLAMVGSVDYADESIDGAVNNVLSAHQPGSTMKPLTYAAALEQGWTPAGILWDVPTVFDTGVGEYRPVNYDGRFHGPVRLRDALANSYNIPAVLLLNEVGVGNLLELAHRFGINSLGDDPSYYGLSLTLGGGEVTPLEMATAFSVFANGGHAVTPVMITRVEDNDGTLLYEAPENPGEEVLDPRIAFQISDILSDNNARTPAMGSESELLLDFPAAAKTGTTNDFRDNWTIGYTPHVVTAVWAGNTNNEEMAEGTSGLTGAAPIWHDFMTALYGMRGIEDVLAGPDLPPLRAEFAPPDRLEQRPVCVLSALRDPVPAESGCPRQQAEWFRVGGPDPAIEPTAQPSPTPVPTLAPRPEGDDTPQPEGPLPGVRQQIEPGILALAVLPVTEEQQAPLMEVLNQQRDALPGQPPAPLPPRYCTVPQERAADLEALAYQIFIEAPLDPTHALNARNWAIENGVPIEPALACPTDVLEEVVEETPDYADVVGVTYFIEDPQPNWQVYGVWPVRGTVLFNPADVA